MFRIDERINVFCDDSSLDQCAIAIFNHSSNVQVQIYPFLNLGAVDGDAAAYQARIGLSCHHQRVLLIG